MNSTISTYIELPEDQQEALQSFLAVNPQYSQDDVFAAALALFLAFQQKQVTA